LGALCERLTQKEVLVANELQGRKVAILIAPVGTEQVEFVQPKEAVEAGGAEVVEEVGEGKHADQARSV
jgi:hypothetical protein